MLICALCVPVFEKRPAALALNSTQLPAPFLNQAAEAANLEEARPAKAPTVVKRIAPAAKKMFFFIKNN